MSCLLFWDTNRWIKQKRCSNGFHAWEQVFCQKIWKLFLSSREYINVCNSLKYLFSFSAKQTSAIADKMLPWLDSGQSSQSVSGHTNNSSFIESGQPDLSAVLSCLYWRFHLVIQKKDWTNKISIISLEKFLIPGFYLLSCLYLLEFVLVLKWVRWDQNLTNIQKTQTSQSPSESL